MGQPNSNFSEFGAHFYFPHYPLSFEERLAAQKKEKEMASQELGFKKPLTKEEKLQKKKQRLAAIGGDLLAIVADHPFRFLAIFTFVVRAFSDGIGKGLDPHFDITEIARPYALELLKFREAGVEVVMKVDRVDKLDVVIERLVSSLDSEETIFMGLQFLYAWTLTHPFIP